MQQRATSGNAGIIDQAEQGILPEPLRNQGSCGFYCLIVGHIHQQRGERFPQLALQSFPIRLFAHAAKYRDAPLAQSGGNAVANACRCPGDDYAFLLSHSCTPY